MKVLLMTTHINTGGITSYLYNLSKGLVKKGHAVYVASSGGDRSDDFRGLGVNLLTLNILTKSEVHPKIYLSSFKVKDFINEQKIDIIHSQTRVTQVMGALLYRLIATPHMSTCHGFFKTRFFRKLFPCWGKRVIAISPAVYDHLINDFKLSRDNVQLIQNGIDVDDFIPLSEQQIWQARQRLNIPQGPIIGIIARLSKEKGHIKLIEAMAKVIQVVPQARLVIIGAGRMEQEIRERVKQSHLARNVYFYDAVNRTIEYLSLFDCFVMPSTQEGLGLSVMEAQAAGLPVVATRVGGLVSLIDDQKTGMLVSPDDVDELARALIYLLLHRHEARQIGNRAREFIKNDCSYIGMTQQTLDLYQTLIR